MTHRPSLDFIKNSKACKGIERYERYEQTEQCLQRPLGEDPNLTQVTVSKPSERRHEAAVTAQLSRYAQASQGPHPHRSERVYNTGFYA
jgi:hypothetical protein